MDKLGLSAQKGVGVVMRQTFYGYSYAMLDIDMNPNPVGTCTVYFTDYYSSRISVLVSGNTNVIDTVFATSANVTSSVAEIND